MDKFSYIRAGSIGDAVRLLNEPGLKNHALAGGTDILLILRHDPYYCDAWWIFHSFPSCIP